LGSVRIFDIPLSTLSTILKGKNTIIAVSSSGGRKRNNKVEHTRLEERLVQWVSPRNVEAKCVSKQPFTKRKSKIIRLRVGYPVFLS